MNLAGKPPLGLKTAKAPRDKARLARVASMPCVICEAMGKAQQTPTQVHHCIHDRHSQARADDSMTIPLCHAHHQGAPGVVGLHSNASVWRGLWGPDWGWLDAVNRRIDDG